VIPFIGVRDETVTDISKRLLAHHGGLRGLGDAKAVRV
jgi:hypothetical protein